MYIITNSTSVGAQASSRNTAKEAIEWALSILGNGKGKVTITAPDGRVYEPNDFPELLRQEISLTDKP